MSNIYTIRLLVCGEIGLTANLKQFKQYSYINYVPLGQGHLGPKGLHMYKL